MKTRLNRRDRKVVKQLAKDVMAWLEAVDDERSDQEINTAALDVIQTAAKLLDRLGVPKP